MLVVIATGASKDACCQPDVLSLVTVAVASWVPSAFHSAIVWVPPFCAAL